MKSRLLLLAGITSFLVGCADSTPPMRYTRPLKSPGEKFSSLPRAVQNTIRAEAGTAEIADIKTVASSPTVIYEVQFHNSIMFLPMYVHADGSVLNTNLSVAVGAAEETVGTSTGGAVGGFKLSDLPTAVVETIHDEAPTSEVDRINKIMLGQQVLYEISFRNPHHNPTLIIADEGTLMKTVPQ